MRGDDEAGYEHALAEELARRVEEVSGYPEDAFGRLGRRDALVIVLACVVAPLLLLWVSR